MSRKLEVLGSTYHSQIDAYVYIYMSSEAARNDLTSGITINHQILVKAFIPWLKNVILHMWLVYKEFPENRCWLENFRKLNLFYFISQICLNGEIYSLCFWKHSRSIISNRPSLYSVWPNNCNLEFIFVLSHFLNDVLWGTDMFNVDELHFNSST